MTSISALSYIHKTGLFGNYKNKSEDNLLKVSDIIEYANRGVSPPDNPRENWPFEFSIRSLI